MIFRHLTPWRRLSTTRVLHRPSLSSKYKSKELWEERFNCDLLGSDSGLIKTINNKIITGIELNNLEIDIFLNIAAPRKNDLSQLQEAVSSLRKFRKSIYANTLLPSTPHAFCRLFLDSEKLLSLINILEKRAEFGIFPDPFALNLLFDSALEKEDYATGSRLAALIMLQEEFGLNQLNDNFALYSLAKYIESKTDFTDWSRLDTTSDPIFSEYDESQIDAKDEANKDKAEEGKAKEEEADDEDDDEKEYVRIPFLRNRYFDNHFDLTDPRMICGKSLSMLGMHHLQSQNEEIQKLGLKCKLAGDILQAKWPDAKSELKKCLSMKVASNSLFIDTLKHYITNHEQPDESLINSLDKISKEGRSLSEEADHRHGQLQDLEKADIERIEADIAEWSKRRLAVKKAEEEIEERKKLIAEIKAKKQELKQREQYLYFYDNLKKSSLTRIEYK